VASNSVFDVLDVIDHWQAIDEIYQLAAKLYMHKSDKLRLVH